MSFEFILKVDGNGNIFGINENQHIVVRIGVNEENPLGTGFREEFVDKKFNYISAGTKNVYAIDLTGKIYYLQVTLY